MGGIHDRTSDPYSLLKLYHLLRAFSLPLPFPCQDPKLTPFPFLSSALDFSSNKTSFPFLLWDILNCYSEKGFLEKTEKHANGKKSKRHSPLSKVYISSPGLANSFIYSSPVSTPFYTCWKHKITLSTLGSLPSIPFFVTFPPKSHYGVRVIATHTF